MSASLICPNCNSPVPSDAPQGMCPRCLLRAGLAGQSLAGDPSVAATAGPDGRFEPPSPDELRRLFPQLEILELLGQGGMGAVYKVRQPGLDRLAALKILPPQIGRDPAFARRFEREARALARLSHPGIVGVYDFGQTGSLCWILMEYVDGADLRRAMKSSLSPAEALAIVPQICDALQYAHDEGVVHRDIKPENVLLDRRGRVKIADFGLAKLLGRELPAPSLTAMRQVMGTPRYMAPEQMEGSEQVDHRADIYSLGVVFYELLTGEAPAGRFPPPSHKARIDVRLDEVVLRSLEREPERRWQQASQIKSQLHSIAESPGQAIAAYEAPMSLAAAQAPASPPIVAYAIGVSNFVAAVVLMFLIAGDPDMNWIPESAGRVWRYWETVSTYLSYALYGLTLLASVGLLLRRSWGRTLTVGTCWASLATLVTDTPYIARFYLPQLYAEIVVDLTADGTALPDAELLSAFFVFLVVGTLMPIMLAWLLFQVIYLNRQSVVVAFDGPDGQRSNALSQALVWAPAVGLLTLGGVAYAILLIAF